MACSDAGCWDWTWAGSAEPTRKTKGFPCHSPPGMLGMWLSHLKQPLSCCTCRSGGGLEVFVCVDRNVALRCTEKCVGEVEVCSDQEEKSASIFTFQQKLSLHFFAEVVPPL